MGGSLVLRTSGPDDTRRAAAALATALRPGDIVSLTGELGAGKTCFVQGAAGALGVTQPVTSPSFLLRRDYRGDVPVIHLDVYRLETLQEVVDLGFDEVTDGGAIAFVEWGDAMRQLLPSDHLEVDLRLGDPSVGQVATDGELGGDLGVAEERRITLRAHGAGWQQRLAEAVPALAAWREDPAPC
jgi:tRNA threonylcarbamoyladenosine biosynthesis protein TsaE